MKRQLALAVALITMITALFASFPASAAFSDVPDDYSYKRAITTLSKLNVINGYENNTFEPEKNITRAEFTKIIVYMLGYDSFTDKITQFDDVSADHWANANIKTAYDLGIINGFDEKTFKPDDPVTYEQALKMIVCTLGYQSLAEQKGGYPVGYQTQAASLGLTDGITGITYTDNASRGVIAQAMYNALEVNMLDSLATESGTQKNLLNDYLHVYILKGTVVGVESSTTNECTVTLNPGQIDIKDALGDEYVMDYTEYTDSYADMNAMLGQTVEAYYRADSNSTDRWLIEIDNETYSNSEITVNSYNIDSYSNGSLSYYATDDAGRATNTRINTSEATIRYNGRAVSGNVTIGDTSYSTADALAQWLDPNSDNFIYGTVKLISGGNSSDYNIIDIYDYETIVAYRSPSSTDYKITDKTVTGNSLTLDPNAVNYSFTITKNGSQIQPTAIAANDVLNYAVSLDGELYTVVDTAESVKGTITSLMVTDTSGSIFIDNVEYRVSERFLSYIKNKEQKELKTGMDITAYTDMFGTLEWGTISTTDTYYPYAYVIDYENEGPTYYLRMFAPSSASVTSFSASTSYRVQSYKIASKVRVDGDSLSGESAVELLRQTAENANPDANIPNADIKLTGVNQLVKFGLNSAGEISQIVTINSGTEGSQNEDNGVLTRYKAMDPENKYYVSTSSVKESSSGATLYSIRSSTPLFVIPKDRTDVESYSLKSAITTNSMSSGGSYYLDAYDVGTTRYPSCVLVYNTNLKSGTPIARTTAYRLVADDIMEEYDSSQDGVYDTLSTYNSTATLSKTLISPAADFNSIAKGDIILCGLDSENMADSYMLVQDYDQIRRVLSGNAITYTDESGTERTETYTWNETQEQTEDNNWQKYVFDWRYPKADLSGPTDDYYQTGGNSTNIFSRAAMFNVLQVLPDENALYVTKNGFDASGAIDDTTYEEIKVSSSTKIVRYDSDTDEFTPYAVGTDSTSLAITDLQDAVYYGADCSKVLITYVSSTTNSSSVTPTARFIVIYD